MKKHFFIFILAFILLSGIAANDSSIKFISLGDWGGAALGGYHLKNVLHTASAITTFMQSSDNQFIINTGDNFYYCGIQNTSDPQITEDYTKLFAQINLPWYNCLGNHDYGFVPEAQLQLNGTIPNWIMDSRYYWRRLNFSGVVINVIALDTNPCVSDYRRDDPSKWDPCSTEFPTCSPVEGQCFFHANILKQACEPQLTWFTRVLDQIPANEWVIVFGHHRAEQVDVADFQSQLDRPNVHLYLNGHVHSLEHYSIHNQDKYITTGAACMVVPNAIKTVGSNNNNVWSKMVSGYTTHRIHDNTLTTEFRNIFNDIIYEFNVSKVFKQETVN
jgi:hypothetical protein